MALRFVPLRVLSSPPVLLRAQRCVLLDAARPCRPAGPRPGPRLPVTVRAKADFAADGEVPIVTYEELKPLARAPTEDILLLDVREPSEVVQGNIPSSVNLPFSELTEALQLEPADFSRKYSFKKPSRDQNIIFYCLAGVRAASALKEFRAQGYRNLRNYEGSWQEWKKRQAQSPDADDD